MSICKANVPGDAPKSSEALSSAQKLNFIDYFIKVLKIILTLIFPYVIILKN